MSKIQTTRDKRSESSKQKMRASAIARHKANAERIRERVMNALADIEGELEEGQGIYPKNRGELSLAEVARRAGIHPLTFYKENYLELARHVKSWIKGRRSDVSKGGSGVKRGLAARVEEWRQLYLDLRDSHRVLGVELSLAKSELNRATIELDRLRSEIADFRSKLGKTYH